MKETQQTTLSIEELQNAIDTSHQIATYLLVQYAHLKHDVEAKNKRIVELEQQLKDKEQKLQIKNRKNQ